MAVIQLDDTRGLAEVIVFPRVYAACASCVREDAILKVKGRVEMKEGVPRVMALELEELHLEPGPDPLYLDAGAFVGRSRTVATEAFEVLRRYPGPSPLTLVSDDGTLDEKICAVEDSSDFHAELKQVLGAKCLYHASRESAPVQAEMERVS